MSAIATAIVGSAVIGGYVQSRSASRAADAQTNASNADIAQRNQQFEAIQKLLQPYVTAGTGALDAQQTLLGLKGGAAQGAAINQLEGSPQFQALLRNGENALLQNASATGGLRGGNTQAALAQFRPAMLSQLIADQFTRLGGITSLGQNAAAGVGNAGMQTSNGISNALQAQGAAQAGLALANGNAISGIVNGVGSGIGYYAAMNKQPGSAFVPGASAGSGFGSGYAFGNQDLGGYF